MFETELTTAKFANPALGDTPVLNQPTLEPGAVPARNGGWDRASSWISIFVGGALVACLAVVAIPYLSTEGSQRPGNPIDWLLWFGGASEDQTFERYIRDASEAGRHEWEEDFRRSPAYRDPDDPIIGFDPDEFDWNFDPPTFGD